MQIQETLISGAVLAAFASVSFAASQIPDLPQKFDQTVEQTDNTNQNSGLASFDEGKVGIVKPMQNNSGGGAPSFLYGTGTDERTNNGTIWVVAGDLGEDGSYGKYVAGMMASNGGNLQNNGTIYVKANTGPLNKETAKGMSADQNGKIVNNGTIVVDGGIGMQLTTKASGQTIINNGDIIVESGYGLNVNINDRTGDAASVKLENNKSITVAAGATGVTLNGAFSKGTFTNTGAITGSGTSISASSAQNLTLKLSGNSHITGNITLHETADIQVSDLKNAETIKINKADQISVTNSDLTITGTSSFSPLNINKVDTAEDASTTFQFDHAAADGKTILSVTSVEGTGDVNVNYTGDVSDDLVNGDAKASNLIDGISLGGNKPESVTVQEGLWGDAAVYYKDGSSDVLSTNSLLSSTTDLALMNGLVWRSQLTNLSDRMGTLRTMPQAMGAWVRYNNGRLDGRGIQYDYNTIEVGFDAPVSSNFLVGVSFDYTTGDTDLNAGSADNDAYTLGLYGSYFGDNGGFVDMMAKIGRIDNEYDISNKSGVESGDYMMTGAIVGVEAGHRFDLAHYIFVEPQVQLSYSWLRATDYSTNIRNVDFETIESLVARVGVMSGLKFNENRGSAYLKASYNHDFLGDIDAEYTAVSASDSYTRKISDELDDNWAEVSLGFSYSITDSLNTFLDVGTGFGGDIDQKWRVNFGGRYTF